MVVDGRKNEMLFNTILPLSYSSQDVWVAIQVQANMSQSSGFSRASLNQVRLRVHVEFDISGARPTTVDMIGL